VNQDKVLTAQLRTPLNLGLQSTEIVITADARQRSASIGVDGQLGIVGREAAGAHGHGIAITDHSIPNATRSIRGTAERRGIERRLDCGAGNKAVGRNEDGVGTEVVGRRCCMERQGSQEKQDGE
jgi:hypothetical protein